MRRVLIPLMFILLFVSCGGDDSSDNKDDGVNCTGVDKFCNSNDGTLWWSDVSNESLNWDAADIECSNLGGRLPTISELRTLVKNCNGTVTDGSCNVTDDCLCYSSSCDCLDGECYCNNTFITDHYAYEYSVFGDTFFLWSASETSDKDQHYAWYIDFATACINTQIKDSLLLFRCVK